MVVGIENVAAAQLSRIGTLYIFDTTCHNLLEQTRTSWNLPAVNEETRGSICEGETCSEKGLAHEYNVDSKICGHIGEITELSDA